MKKYLLWRVAVLLVICTTLYAQRVGNMIPENKMNKSISIAVYKGSTYQSKIYNNTFATLHITIEKVNGLNHTIVWDKIFDAKLLKQYPDAANAFAQKVVVENILKKKE